MLLTDMAETLLDHINSSPEKWQDVEPYQLATIELDPLQCMSEQLGVYIIPGVVDYNITPTSGRGRVLTLESNNFISLVVSQSFSELPSGVGVTLWTEGKRLLDIRQRVEELIISYVGFKLLDVDAEPLSELELDNRNFIAFTTFQYEGAGCPGAHLLP